MLDFEINLRFLIRTKTILKSLKPDLIINFSNQKEFLEYVTNPNALIEAKETSKPKSILIDEIQRLPSVLNTVQSIIDENKQIKFYLTGSSARKLKRGNANLLPGRLLDYKLGSIVSSEVDYNMNLEKVLSFGTLPEIYLNLNKSEPKKILKSYSTLYLKEEIQAEALTRNLESFSRFFNAVIEMSVEFIDYTKLAKIAKISRHSCSRYFEVLEDTLIADRIFPEKNNDR